MPDAELLVVNIRRSKLLRQKRENPLGLPAGPRVDRENQTVIGEGKRRPRLRHGRGIGTP